MTPSCPSRSAVARGLARRVGVALEQTDFRAGLRRGRCAQRRCPSRFAIVRVTIDLRDPTRQDHSATLECALCGRTWTRAPVPDLRLSGGRQPRVLLTIHAPPPRGESRRTYRTTRGALRVVGTDSRTIVNASYRDLEIALEDWQRRGGTRRERLLDAWDRVAESRERERIAQEAIPDVRESMQRLADLEALIRSIHGGDPAGTERG